MSQQLDLGADERYCRDLTRHEAANFYWGFIALPKVQRTAIYALYSFARQVDDEADLASAPERQPVAYDGAYDGAVDGQAPRLRSAVAERLQVQRERVAQCYDGGADDPVMRVLAGAVRQYGIPRAELESLIDGVAMDLRITRYGSWEELRSYCRHVASSVGRMCVRIFGFSTPAALDYADDLGVAMQLANILRDVHEDMGMGRIYLPQDDLRRFGVSERTIRTGQPGPEWEPFVHFEIQRARQLFTSGLRVTRVIPRRSAACVLTMAGIYQSILDQIERNPTLPLSQRISLAGREKVSVMVRSWLQAM